MKQPNKAIEQKLNRYCKFRLWAINNALNNGWNCWLNITPKTN